MMEGDNRTRSGAKDPWGRAATAACTAARRRVDRVGLRAHAAVAARERAKGRGMPSATYIASLVRAHFLDAAPLPKGEYLAIKQAVGELSAIGRNLNQIARAMNQGGRAAPPGREEVIAMVKVAGALRDHIKSLVSANTRAWGTGHAQKPH